jgi:hypothetical protein
MHLDCHSLEVTDLSLDPDAITVHAESSAATLPARSAATPRTASTADNSRQVADLPVQASG